MPFEELDPLERIDEQPAAILENERLPKTKKPKDDSRF